MNPSMPTLPAAFVGRLQALLGTAEATALCDALGGPSPVSIRLNRAKGGTVPTGAVGVPWCRDGYYLAERPVFTLDPAFHGGAYYVQEAASMLIEQAFRRIDAPVGRLLDLCAAPGGKSTLWRSLLPDDALLVANEPVPQRAHILAENLAKWGHPDVCVTRAYPADFGALTGFFDVIAADVPCSGEGMFRKDAGAIDEWTPDAPTRCRERQWGIISDVWPALREGGWLVYSTCTFNREENEDNVRRICRELGAEVVPLDIDAQWGMVGDTTGGDLPVVHCFPHRTRGEGFFLALLRKTAPCPTGHRRTGRRAATPAAPAGAKTAAAWLQTSERYRLFATGATQLSAVSKALYDDVQRIAATVRTLTAGLPLAEEKGRKLIPLPTLALSTARAADAFPSVALSRREALAYLRREALTLPPETPRGYVTATYEGLALGFLNHLGTRANNLYPAEWRIRMQG